MKKKLFITLIAVMTALSVLVGCSSKITPALEDYYPQPSTEGGYGIPGAEVDENITLDGVADEDGWGRSLSVSDGEMAALYKTRFEKKGFYVYFEISDTVGFGRADKAVEYNPNFSVYVANGLSERPDGNAVHLKVDCFGRVKTQAFDADGRAYDRYAAHNAAVVAASPDGKTPFGFKGEIFIPWRTLQLDAAPDSVKLLPCYTARYSENETKVYAYDNVSVSDVAQYIRATPEGLWEAPAPASALGDSLLSYTQTGVWEKEGLNVASNSSNTEQRIYFEGYKGDRYMIETTATFIHADTDPFPKLGVIMAQNGDGSVIGMLDAETDDRKTVYAVKAAGNTVNWDWPGVSAYNGGIDLKGGTDLKIIRDQETFYFFVNDTYLFHRTIDGYSKDAVAGFITFGARASFTDCKLVYDDAEIAGALNALAIDKDGWTGFGDFKVAAGGIRIPAAMADKTAGETYIEYGKTSIAGNAVTMDIDLKSIDYLRSAPSSPKLTFGLTGGNDSITYNPAAKILSTTVAGVTASSKLETGLSNLKLTRIVDGTKAKIRIFADDKKIKDFETSYAGSYTLRVTSDFVSGFLSAPKIQPTVARYGITIKAGAGGAVTADVENSAAVGDDCGISVVPELGNCVESFKINGVEAVLQIEDGRYVIESIRENITVEAAFKALPAARVSFSGSVLLTGNLAAQADKTAVSVILYGAGQTIKTNCGVDGGYRFTDVPQGTYRAVYRIGAAAEEKILQLTADGTENVTLAVPDNPEINGSRAYKEIYYTDARKMEFTTGGEKANVYGYIGSDAIYLYAEAADNAIGSTSPELWDFDNLEFIVVLPEYVRPARTAGHTYRFLFTADGNALMQAYGASGWTSEGAIEAAYETVRTPDGYAVECKIPFADLALDSAPQYVGIGAGRVNVKDKLRYFSALNDADLNCPLTYALLSDDKFASVKDCVTPISGIDGDLSDRAAFAQNAWKVKETGGPRGVDYHLTKQGDGVLVVGSARFNNLNFGSATWYNNTNIELCFDAMQIGIYLKTNDAFACTVKNLYYQMAHVLTVNEDGAAYKYTLTFEIYIPYAAVGESVRMGFAFKSGSASSATQGDVIDVAGGGRTDWWYVPGHMPTTVSEQFEVTENGMLCKTDGHADHTA